VRGEYLSFLENEIRSALEGVQKKDLNRIIIAYEPIWTIGKTSDDAMAPHEVYETALFLRKVLAEKYDKKSAFSVAVVYGGSVELKNSSKLLSGGGINGFLVGHASLDPLQFGEILKIANKSK